MCAKNSKIRLNLIKLFMEDWMLFFSDTVYIVQWKLLASILVQCTILSFPNHSAVHAVICLESDTIQETISYYYHTDLENKKNTCYTHKLRHGPTWSVAHSTRGHEYATYTCKYCQQSQRRKISLTVHSHSRRWSEYQATLQDRS